jgi:ribosomal protein S2
MSSFELLLEKSIKENDRIINDYIVGYYRKFLNSNMLEYISNFKKINNKEICIFNKELVIKNIIETCKLLYNYASNEKNVLFFGLNYAYCELIEKYATNCKSYYVNNKSFGGFFTNFNSETLKNIIIFEQINEYFINNNDLSKIKKKKVNTWKKINLKYNKMKNFYNGLIGLRKIPDIVVFLGFRRIEKYILECLKIKNVKIINLMDINGNINKKYNNLVIPIGLNFLTYNPEKKDNLDYIMGLFSDSILLGKNNVKIDANLKTLYIKE